jgi:hypothetical protein
MRRVTRLFLAILGATVPTSTAVAASVLVQLPEGLGWVRGERVLVRPGYRLTCGTSFGGRMPHRAVPANLAASAFSQVVVPSNPPEFRVGPATLEGES